ncbi:MAG: hypothetical protein ACREE2_11265 [Stellaceae bacterium]
MAFLLFACRYRRQHRPAHLATIRQFGGELFIFRRPAEVAAFVAGLAP